jgi:hypothetical protein
MAFSIPQAIGRTTSRDVPRAVAAAEAQAAGGRDGGVRRYSYRRRRIVECAMPWKEIPRVKALLEAGKGVKFSFRVNHDDRAAALELAAGPYGPLRR